MFVLYSKHCFNKGSFSLPFVGTTSVLGLFVSFFVPDGVPTLPSSGSLSISPARVLSHWICELVQLFELVFKCSQSDFTVLDS